MTPSVSIIIASFNYANFLPHTLECALSQQGVTPNVMVVDDGSTDHTGEVLASYGDSIRHIRQENRGLSAARNAGLAQAQGEYTVFLDADDLLAPGTLASQCALLQDNAEVGLALCRCQAFSADAPGGPMQPGDFYPMPQAHWGIHMCRRNIAPPHAWMLRSKDAAQIGGFDTSLKVLEDYDYWLRALAANLAPAFNPEGLALHRRHAGSLSDNTQRMLTTDCLLHERMHALLQQPGFMIRHKPDAWLAHASRTLGLAYHFCEQGEATGPAMAALGLDAIKRIAAEMARNAKNRSGDDYTDRLFLVNALQCASYLELLAQGGETSMQTGLTILGKLCPETTRSPARRAALHEELEPLLYVA